MDNPLYDDILELAPEEASSDTMCTGEIVWESEVTPDEQD